jgi:cell division control protein 6
MEIESKIFKNEEVLMPEYLPEILPHRENQIKILAENLLATSKGRRENTFIFGPPGIGKTATVKYVFREFENYSGLKTVYINCWEYGTATAVLSHIALSLGMFVQRHGWSKDEIITRLVEGLKKWGKGVVVCLDEVDQLIFKDSSVLYDLIRIDQYVKNPPTLIFVSNNPHVFAKVEPRIRSSLSIEEIEFKPYTLQEMKDILEERAKHAFTAVEKGVVLLAANRAVQMGGDVRVGLDCLLKAGRLAEKENAELVKVEHVKRVLKDVEPVKPKILREKISEHEKILLDILEKEKSIPSGDLYRKYCEVCPEPISDRAFRDLLRHLQELKLVKIRKGKPGNLRIVSKI